MGTFRSTFAMAHFLNQTTRISLIKWNCRCLNFSQFPLKNSYSLLRVFAFLKIFETQVFPILKCSAITRYPIFGIFFCASIIFSLQMTNFFFSFEQKAEILSTTSLLECFNLQKDLMKIEHSKNRLVEHSEKKTHWTFEKHFNAVTSITFLN